MRIITTYRGKTVQVVNDEVNVWQQQNGIEISTKYQSGRKSYRVDIEASELLKVAKAACGKLSVISGVDYGVFVRVNEGQSWVKI